MTLNHTKSLRRTLPPFNERLCWELSVVQTPPKTLCIGKATRLRPNTIVLNAVTRFTPRNVCLMTLLLFLWLRLRL